MSKYTSQGRLKAKHNPAYRDPKFFGGLCCVCKKRPRRYNHEHYPHMCDKCRESRVFSKDLPFTDPGVAQNIRDYDFKVRHSDISGPIQTLNGPGTSLAERIKESAERFRAQKTKG